METATVDGITSTSASESADQINAALSYSDDAPASTPESTPAAEAKPASKKSSIQSRIDELSAQNANKDQAISTLNARLSEIDTLKQELAALKARPAERQPERQPEPPRQADDAEPTEDEFESYGAFVKAQAKWAARQERQSWERDQAKRQQAQTAEQRNAEVMATFQERLNAAKTTIPNFDAVLASTLPLSRPMQDVIRQSEIGPQLMAHLHEHPEDHARIYNAGHPLEVFRQMNKLEARLEAAVDSGPAPKAKPVSNAKPPIKPLGAAKSGPVSDEPPGDDASYEEHERYWNRVELERAGRGR